VSQPAKVTIHKIPTGVRGLDDILGGGIPEFSFNIIAGSPGKRPRRLVFAMTRLFVPAAAVERIGAGQIAGKRQTATNLNAREIGVFCHMVSRCRPSFSVTRPPTRPQVRGRSACVRCLPTREARPCPARRVHARHNARNWERRDKRWR
jgi:hypothetical protein